MLNRIHHTTVLVVGGLPRWLDGIAHTGNIGACGLAVAVADPLGGLRSGLDGKPAVAVRCSADANRQVLGLGACDEGQGCWDLPLKIASGLARLRVQSPCAISASS